MDLLKEYYEKRLRDKMNIPYEELNPETVGMLKESIGFAFFKFHKAVANFKAAAKKFADTHKLIRYDEKPKNKRK